MNEFETQVAESIRDGINAWSNATERSQQSQARKIGVSEIGYCGERLRRTLDHQESSDEVSWFKAFLGTAVGDYIERVQQQHVWPDAIYQSEVTIVLKGDVRTYTIVGHPDVVIPPCEQFPGGAILDNKAPGELTWVRRKDTADQSYQFQRNLYALGAYEAGMLGTGPIEDVMVGNIYVDRSGKEDLPHVQVEPFSHDVIFSATQWLDEVVYNYLNDEEAMKEPPREMCTVCQFFTVCRASDTDVEGRLDHPETLEAVEMYQRAAQMQREARKLKDAAQIRLQGAEGHTHGLDEDVTLRWTRVGGGSVSYQREPYLKLQMTKRKKK